MITEQDLREAIAECQGVRNPNANTCIKLASYYTILHHLENENENEHEHNIPSYSYAPPLADNIINYHSDTEFSQIINGRQADEIWRVMDELMSTLQVINPRLYDGVIRKLQ